MILVIFSTANLLPFVDLYIKQHGGSHALSIGLPEH